MNPIVKKLLTVVLVLAVLVYTFLNYTAGKVSLTGLFLACAVLGYPMVNILSSLIEDLKKK